MSKLALLGGPKAVTLDGTEAQRWPIYTEEDEQALLDVFRRVAMSGTDITQKFEREFADYLGCGYAIGTTNGTSALEECLYAVGLGRGDELICPSMTYWASCSSIYKFGATVVFADCDPVSLCIRPDDIEHRITPRTKAIMVVHYLAHPADMDPIMEIARKHGLAVIEDVSHATGGKYKGRRLGTIGDCAGQSLMSLKSFAIGEGGMFTTNNRHLFERALQYSHYERNSTDFITDPELQKLCGIAVGGAKGRMNQGCAAIGRVQLKYYESRMKEIQAAMNYLWDQIRDLPGLIDRRPVWEDSDMGGWYCPHGVYNADELGGLSIERFCEACKAEGVFAVPGANFPLHTHEMFQSFDAYHDGKPSRIANSDWDVREGDKSLPISEQVNSTVFYTDWIKKLDKPYIDQIAQGYRKVCENYEELLPGDEKRNTVHGIWHF